MLHIDILRNIVPRSQDLMFNVLYKKVFFQYKFRILGLLQFNVNYYYQKISNPIIYPSSESNFIRYFQKYPLLVH